MTEAPPEEVSTWLDVSTVETLLGDAVEEAGGIRGDSMQGICDAVRAYVEGRRPDLFLVDGSGFRTGTYAPGADVVLGAAMLAWRFYARRNTPLGVIGFSEDGAAGMLREDPDVTRLLGLGRKGRFVFGGTGRRAAL